jgi:hypothetical protein
VDTSKHKTLVLKNRSGLSFNNKLPAFVWISNQTPTLQLCYFFGPWVFSLVLFSSFQYSSGQLEDDE